MVAYIDEPYDDGSEWSGKDLLKGGVPPSELIRNDPEELKRYGPGATEIVLAEETHTGEALDKSDLDPIGIADWKTHHDNRLVEKVRTTRLQRRAIDRRMKRHNAQARAHDAPLEFQIAAWTSQLDEALAACLKAKQETGGKLLTALEKAAAACAEANLPFSPDSPIPKIPDPNRLLSLAAHAATLELPYDPEEQEHFLNSVVEWALSGFTGFAVGLSAFGAGGLIHLTALGTKPVAEVLAALFGTSVTLLAGYAAKLLWRNASEAYYLGKFWFGRMLLAMIITGTLYVLETAVDQRGLMALQGVHQLASSLSGKAAAGLDSGGSVGFWLIGSVISLPYFAYCSIRGWFKARRAALNRILASREKERLDEVVKLQSGEAYGKMLQAGNLVTALRAADEELANAHEETKRLIEKRIEQLNSQLAGQSDRPTEDDVLMLEYAIAEAEGQQIESDRRLQALREGHVYIPKHVERSARRPLGIFEWMKGLFRRQERTTEGA